MPKSGYFIKLVVAIALITGFSHICASQAQEEAALLPDFFSGLYDSHEKDFKRTHDGDYQMFCKTFNIDHKNTSNQEKYFKILFYHKMLTGSDSIDCVKGGMLGIPYMWHWVEPNPRYEIIDNESGRPLTKKKPPNDFAQYKTFADIDRTPRIYLKDLVSEQPGYRHPDCSEFYTFGWCSEREMSFSLLMGIFGFKSKIVQEGPHVTSNFWLVFSDMSGRKTNIMAMVDNTYDRIEWKNANRLAFDSWYDDMGKIKMVKWYNSKARSNEERERVKNIRVGSKAADRIEGLVKRY